MSVPLLQTKLYIPPARNEFVARSRLIEKLNQGLHGKLTLISAPAGFGKTTLVADWLRQLDGAAVWLSLDEADNDQVRFLTYFIAALQKIQPSIGQTIQMTLQTFQQSNGEFVLVSLINAIAELPEKTVLVLDDYHAIKDEAVHQVLDYLIQHLPPQLHLIITSRADPPLHLSRLRARAEMMELRAADLRFNLAEATTFLNQNLSLNLSAAQVQALEAQTEGWVVGLQMAALSLRRHKDVSHFIETFSGSHRYIIDYLAEEVLDQQSLEIQMFLMQTAILERLTAPLCDALTGNRNSQAMLTHLEQSNLFLIPLDDERRWYRYHHLFTDLLRHQLEQTQPNQIDTLHRQACEWYASHGFTAEAIEHALLGKQFEQAAAHLIGVAETFWMRGEFSTVLAWLEKFPAEFVRAQPRLCLYYAWTLYNYMQIDAVVSRLQEAEAALEVAPYFSISISSEERAELRGIIAAIRSALPPLPDQPWSRFDYAQQAFKLLPENSLTWRGIAAISRGVGYRSQGQLVAAHQALSEAQAINQAAHNQYLRWASMINLAEVQRLQGKLHQALRTYQQVLRLLSPSLGRGDLLTKVDAPIVDPLMQSDIYIGLGTIVLAWNQLDLAESYLHQGMALMRQANNYSLAPKGYMAFVGLLQAQGKTETAAQAILEMEQLATDRLYAIQDPQLTACDLAWMWLQQGQQSNALAWAKKAGLITRTGPGMPVNYQYDFGHLVLAKMMMAQNKPQIALTILDSFHQTIQDTGQIDRLAEILILQTMAHYQHGDQAKAMSTLEQALALVEPGGYVRLFVAQGEPMAALLRRAVSQGIHIPYVRRLLESFEDKLDTPPTQALIEALTNREMDVLRWLDSELSIVEIGEQLFVSPNTVKTHLKNIYAKLGTRSRYEATVAAKERGLL